MVTVVVNVRDKFSTLDRCLRDLEANTAPEVPILAILGGAPHDLLDRWQQDHGHRVRFDCFDRFLSQAEARNLALRRCTDDLLAMLDSDVYVRAGWLDALLACQRDTAAAAVVPLVLEEERRIHCAGNELYVNYEDQTPYGHKVLSFHGCTYGNGCNLPRRRIDYGELHCQLVVRHIALEQRVYDERIIEVGEVDSGLAWAAGGQECWFEPGAVVEFDLHHPLEACDIDMFEWRWDMEAIAEGYRVFEEKWGLDITEQGRFREFLIDYNAKLPLLPRLLRTDWSLQASRALERWRHAPRNAARALKARVRVLAYRGSEWAPAERFHDPASPERRPFVRPWSPFRPVERPVERVS